MRHTEIKNLTSAAFKCLTGVSPITFTMASELERVRYPTEKTSLEVAHLILASYKRAKRENHQLFRKIV